MHDPYTQVFSFRHLFTIWHVDPKGRGPIQRLRRALGAPVPRHEDSCDWPGWRRELDAKECALWEAINDLEHKLGNPPYYPALYPERELEALDAAIHAWQRRSRWRLHPRWHLWHWEITIHPLNRLKRWLWTRCAGCGKRFAYGESPVTGAWNGPGPRWFRGEPHLYHDACYSRAYPPRLVTVVVENFGPPAGGAPP